MKKIVLIILAILVISIPAIFCFGESATTPTPNWADNVVGTSQPIDMTGWIDGVLRSTNTTTLPYIPSLADTTDAVSGTTTSTLMYVRNFNGILVRARYDRIDVISTTPVIRAWGYRESSWQALPDSDGNYDITITSDVNKDGGNNVNYRWTAHKKIPTLGCFKVILTLPTAFGVTYSTSAAVEVTRY